MAVHRPRPGGGQPAGGRQRARATRRGLARHRRGLLRPGARRNTRERPVPRPRRPSGASSGDAVQPAELGRSAEAGRLPRRLAQRVPPGRGRAARSVQSGRAGDGRVHAHRQPGPLPEVRHPQSASGPARGTQGHVAAGHLGPPRSRGRGDRRHDPPRHCATRQRAGGEPLPPAAAGTGLGAPVGAVARRARQDDRRGDRSDRGRVGSRSSPRSVVVARSERSRCCTTRFASSSRAGSTRPTAACSPSRPACRSTSRRRSTPRWAHDDVTDCEGPLTRNDNAQEIAERFIPDGAEFFARIAGTTTSSPTYSASPATTPATRCASYPRSSRRSTSATRTWRCSAPNRCCWYRWRSRRWPP